MVPNFLILLAAAVIPLAFSMIWFSPSLFGGDQWNKMANIPEEKSKTALPIWKAMISIIFNFLIAYGLFCLCLHQSAVLSLVGGDPELLQTGIGAEFMATYGQGFISFGHGVLHAVLGTIIFVFPILMYVTIFERKGAKYFWVNFTFWLISLSLMGGVIGQWGGVLV